MNSICIKFVCTLMMFIVLAGCEKTVEKEDSDLAIDPMAKVIVMPPEFASLAIDKTGGLEAWGKVRQLQLQCIVTFYDVNAGYYLTEQKVDVFPWSDSIVIAGTELRKAYKWQLSRGKFDILQGTGQLSNFKNQIPSSYFAEAILDIVTAPVRFMDKSFVYARNSTEVNIQGRLCYPIKIDKSSGNVSNNNTVFYQNKADSRIDMALLTNTSDDTSFLVCGYDYNEINDKGILVPNRIEIYLADENGIVQRQLFRIDVSSSK